MITIYSIVFIEHSSSKVLLLMLITKVIISVRITIFYELYSILLAYQKILLISLVYINGFNRSGLIAAPLRIILVGTLPRLSFTSNIHYLPSLSLLISSWGLSFINSPCCPCITVSTTGPTTYRDPCSSNWFTCHKSSPLLK